MWTSDRRLQKLAVAFFLALLGLMAISTRPHIPSVFGAEESGTISFESNSIPELKVYYEDFSFVFQYKARFMRLRPFIIYEGNYYGIKQIVQFIKNNYPNVNYTWLIDKAEQAVHYGFNLTRLPQNIADKIDYLGFKLIDCNFPLSWLKLEETEIIAEDGSFYNITQILIPKINLILSFEDLYPYGYDISHVNKTHVLIGNVKGRTDLYCDPLTYSSNIITVVGGTSDFDDLWVADKGGTLELLANQSASNHVLTTQARPTDNKSIHLEIIASQVTVNGSCFINGTEKDDSIQTENITINANSTFSTSLYYKTVNYINTTGTWHIQVNQSQWGEVWKQNDYEFVIDSQLVLGDGSTVTTFKDIQKKVVFTSSLNPVIRCWNQSKFYLGTLLNLANKVTRDGCELIFLSTYNWGSGIAAVDGALVYLYSCTLRSPNSLRIQMYGLHDARVWNCKLHLQTAVIYDSDFYNTDISTTTTGLQTLSGCTTDRMIISYCTYATQRTMQKLTNALLFFNTYEKYNDWNVVSYYINVYADTDDWNLAWGAGANQKFWRQYTFNLKVTYSGTPIEDANVTVIHLGEEAGQDFFNQTDNSGEIQEQILSKGFYNRTGDDVLYDYNPFQLIIEADGYTTFYQDFTLERELDWVIELQPDTRLAGWITLAIFGFIGGLLMTVLMLSYRKTRKG